jgi:myosin heavy subunit
MTPEETDNQTDGTATPTNDVSKSQPPGVGPTYDRELVYADDGKPWREKFHGLKGHIQQVESDYKKRLEETQSTLEQLKTTVGERESKIEELTGKLTNAGEQLGELQALQDRVPELEQQARKAAKLERILEYPELANRQVTDLIKTEDGEETEMKINPIMNLVLNSSLEGDELTAELERLNRMIKAGETVPEPKNTNLTDNAVPAPGQQVEETPEYWVKKAREAQAAANADPSNRKKHLDDMAEFSQKAREARAELQS